LGKGEGFGKVIFFGEHFAVYSIPVIAMALAATADAQVVRTGFGGWDIWDDRQESKGYKEEKKKMQVESLERIFQYLKFRPEHLRIQLAGDLPAMSGIGATGASSVAVVRALSDEFQLHLTNDEVNAASYQAEVAYHGPKTSGIDNMVSTFGGVIYLIRGEPNVVRRMRLKNPVEIVIGDTGIVANTRVMLERFAERKIESPERYRRILDEANQIAARALSCIEAFDLAEIGQLLNQNHSLLQEAEISCPELDFLVDLCRREGAVGAKLTGGGGGGCMLALTPGKSLQEKVAGAIEREGFQPICTMVGVN
jgi:mevalonate kinase